MITLFPFIFNQGHITDTYYPLCDENGQRQCELRINMQYLEINSPIGLNNNIQDANKTHRTIFDSLTLSKRTYYSIAHHKVNSHKHEDQQVLHGPHAQVQREPERHLPDHDAQPARHVHRRQQGAR